MDERETMTMDNSPDTTTPISRRKLMVRLIICAVVAAACIIAVIIGSKSLSGDEPPATSPQAQTPEADPSQPPSPADEALEAVRPILEREGKIAAIKAYRERTGVGLREAKEAVDSLDD